MGTKTRVYCERVLPSGVTVSATETKSLDSRLKIAKNFTLTELANNKASDQTKAIINNEVMLHAEMLQQLRDAIGEPLTVNSWYRTTAFNRKCGGSSNSLHLKALATDISFPRLNDAKYKRLLALWQQICADHKVIGGINRYTNGIHVSSREDLLGAKSFVTRDYRGRSGDW